MPREPLYAIPSIDALLEKLGGGVDNAVNMRGVPQRRNAGARGLAVRVIMSAMEDAQLPEDCALRRDARAWLRNASEVYSARVCFEGVDIDYDAAIAKLNAQWRG